MPALPTHSKLLAFLVFAAALSAGRAAPSGDTLPRPLTLRAAVAFALAHNPGLRRVREQIAEQEGVVVEANAQERPTVQANSSYAYTQPRLIESIPGFPEVPVPDANAWQVGVTVRQLVYSGGAVQARVSGARERTAAARSAMTAAVNQTVFAVEQDFFGVLLARQEIRVQQEALRVLQRESEQARVRRKAGTGSDFEVMRADVAVANARPALIRAENAFRSRQDALRTDMGVDTGAADDEPALDLQGRLAAATVKVSLADAIRTARARRPELQTDQRLIAAARDDVSAARAGLRPDVSVVGGYELNKRAYSAGLGETLNGFTLGAQVEWPIFDGRATRGRVGQASARVAQAIASRDELRLQIDLQVRNAHRALGEASDLLSSARQVIGEAVESLRLAQTRVTAGTATQLDVLTAQAALTQARSNLSQAEYDYIVGLARLRLAMGTSSVAE